MTPEARNRLHYNIARSMNGVPKDIIQRQLEHFDKADPAYGQGVRNALSEL
jgi:catalase